MELKNTPTSPNLPLSHITGSVAKVAKEAGAFIRSQLDELDASDIVVKDLNSLVSYVDIESEKFIVSKLRTILPQAGYITEEVTVNGPGEDPSLYWIIDPLDGTTNFIHRIPFFCVSIGLKKNDDYISGVVYDVMNDELFHAWSGGGAYVDDKKIRVSQSAELGDAVLATGFPYSTIDKVGTYINVFTGFVKQARGIRRLGSAALDMCYVARGSFGGYYEHGLNEYDVAAGICIVREAGGHVTDFYGGAPMSDGRTILASNASLHKEMLATIDEFYK